MRTAPTAAIAAVLLVVSTSSAGTAVAAEEVAELSARTYFAAGEYKQALDVYAQLYAQTLHPTYLRNIGRCHQNMGEPDKAISSFREYLRKAENLDAKQRAEVERFIAEMEELKRRRETPEASPSAAAPRLFPPRASVPADETSPVGAAPGLRTTPPASGPTAPIYSRWWFWTAVAAVAVGGVATTVALSSGSGTPQVATTLNTMRAIPEPPQ